MDLQHIFALIDAFSDNSDHTLEIPFELNKKERITIHDYIQKKGLFSLSTSVGFQLKTITVYREQIIDSLLTVDDVLFFIRYTSIPIAIKSVETIEYYIQLFDHFYPTMELWQLFNKERLKLKLKSLIFDVRDKILSYFDSNAEYMALSKATIGKTKIKINKNIYIEQNANRHFISFDIRKANFTMLKQSCPTLFISEDESWENFIRKYTESEFIVKSKYFREVLFGKSKVMNKLQLLSELYMDKLHTMIMNEFNDDLVLEMKSGDELVYLIVDIDKFMIKKDQIISQILCPSIHVRIFELNKINEVCESRKYYYKKFLFSTNWNEDTVRKIKDIIEFKQIPNHFMPQIIKWYIKEPIIEEDLLFEHDGMLAVYKTPII